MKSLRAGCDDGMNMISHGQRQAAIIIMVTPRILREVEREIPEMGGGRVAASFLFLSTKMTSTVKCQMSPFDRALSLSIDVLF